VYQVDERLEMSRFNELNAVAVRLCNCDGERTHDLELEDYSFPDGSVEMLPLICVENEILNTEIYQRFLPVLKTLESNENWTMFACYSGMIAQVSPGLYFYSFGDIDEAGETNYYVKCEIFLLIDLLLGEWGPSAPPWREFLQSVGERGLPSGYQPGTMVDPKFFFPQLDEEGLTVGMSYNYEMPDLHLALRALK
jgi:hypothetical protein